jgi:alpha-tubulin suppressor-like RCC1 family protein
MALSDKSCVYSWGDNDWGQLGFPTNINASNTPKLIELFDGTNEKPFIEKISCGQYHCLFYHMKEIFMVSVLTISDNWGTIIWKIISDQQKL